MVGLVHDVRDDDGDVVRAAAAQCELDEPIGRCLRVGQSQCVGDGFVADHARQPVRAQHVPVAESGLSHGHIGMDAVASVESPREEAALRVRLGLLGGDAADVDEVLDQGVVVRELFELAVPEQVGAGVADMDQSEASPG